MSGKEKVTDIEHEKRLNAVEEWLLEGQPRINIIEACATSYGVEARTVDRWMQRVRARLKKRFERDAIKRQSEWWGKVGYIHRRAVEGNDFSTALNALKEMAKYAGDYAPTKVDNNVTIRDVSEAKARAAIRRMTPADRKAYIEGDDAILDRYLTEPEPG